VHDFSYADPFGNGRLHLIVEVRIGPFLLLLAALLLDLLVARLLDLAEDGIRLAYPELIYREVAILVGIRLLLAPWFQKLHLLFNILISLSLCCMTYVDVVLSLRMTYMMGELPLEKSSLLMIGYSWTTE
jgi:hypothetical protein